MPTRQLASRLVVAAVSLVLALASPLAVALGEASQPPRSVKVGLPESPTTSQAKAARTVFDPVCRGRFFPPELAFRGNRVFGGIVVTCFGSFSKKFVTVRRVTVCVQRLEGSGRRGRTWRSLDCDRKRTQTSFGRVILFAESRCRTGRVHRFRVRARISLRRGSLRRTVVGNSQSAFLRC